MIKQTERLERPPFVYWVCLWGSALAVALVYSMYDIFSSEVGTPPGRDFSNLYTAGRLAIDGKAFEAFDINVFWLAHRDIVGVLTLQNYSYPPHALFIAMPFALLPYGLSFALWTILSLAFFYWAAKPFVRFAPILAILTPAAALNVWNGHYGLLLGGLWLLYFRYLRERPVRAGLIAAAMTFKPHMGLLVGLSALTNWRVLLAAVAGIAFLILISAWAFDWASWYGFLGQTVDAQTDILTRQRDQFYFRLMPSAFAAYGRGPIALVTHFVTALAAIGLLVRYRRIDPFVLSTATFLIIPYVFVYDMTVVCLGFANILWMNWQRLAPWERVVLTLAFLSPVITIMWALVSPMLVPPVLLAGLYIQTKPDRGLQPWKLGLAATPRSS